MVKASRRIISGKLGLTDKMFHFTKMKTNNGSIKKNSVIGRLTSYLFYGTISIFSIVFLSMFFI